MRFGAQKDARRLIQGPLRDAIMPHLLLQPIALLLTVSSMPADLSFNKKRTSMAQKPDLAALFGATNAETFLGLPACKDLTNIDASSAFIGAPCATPYGSVGAYAQNGPESLRQAIASLTANINRHNFDLGGPTFPEGTKRAVDCGDLSYKAHIIGEKNYFDFLDTINEAIESTEENREKLCNNVRQAEANRLA